MTERQAMPGVGDRNEAGSGVDSDGAFAAYTMRKLEVKLQRYIDEWDLDTLVGESERLQLESQAYTSVGGTIPQNVADELTVIRQAIDVRKRIDHERNNAAVGKQEVADRLRKMLAVVEQVEAPIGDYILVDGSRVDLSNLSQAERVNCVTDFRNQNLNVESDAEATDSQTPPSGHATRSAAVPATSGTPQTPARPTAAPRLPSAPRVMPKEPRMETGAEEVEVHGGLRRRWDRAPRKARVLAVGAIALTAGAGMLTAFSGGNLSFDGINSAMNGESKDAVTATTVQFDMSKEQEKLAEGIFPKCAKDEGSVSIATASLKFIAKAPVRYTDFGDKTAGHEPVLSITKGAIVAGACDVDGDPALTFVAGDAVVVDATKLRMQAGIAQAGAGLAMKSEADVLALKDEKLNPDEFASFMKQIGDADLATQASNALMNNAAKVIASSDIIAKQQEAHVKEVVSAATGVQSYTLNGTLPAIEIGTHVADTSKVSVAEDTTVVTFENMEEYTLPVQPVASEIEEQGK